MTLFYAFQIFCQVFTICTIVCMIVYAFLMLKNFVKMLCNNVLNEYCELKRIITSINYSLLRLSRIEQNVNSLLDANVFFGVCVFVFCVVYLLIRGTSSFFNTNTRVNSNLVSVTNIMRNFTEMIQLYFSARGFSIDDFTRLPPQTQFSIIQNAYDRHVAGESVDTILNNVLTAVRNASQLNNIRNIFQEASDLNRSENKDIVSTNTTNTDDVDEINLNDENEENVESDVEDIETELIDDTPAISPSAFSNVANSLIINQ